MAEPVSVDGDTRSAEQRAKRPTSSIASRITRSGGSRPVERLRYECRVDGYRQGQRGYTANIGRSTVSMLDFVNRKTLSINPGSPEMPPSAAATKWPSFASPTGQPKR